MNRYEMKQYFDIIDKSKDESEIRSAKDILINDFDNGKRDFYRYFEELFDEISISDFFKYYDIEKVNEYFKNNNLRNNEYKLLVRMFKYGENTNEVLNAALNNEHFFKIIVEHIKEIQSCFENINYEIALKFIKKLSAYKDNLPCIIVYSLNSEDQKKLMSEKYDKDTYYWIFKSLNNKVQSELLNDGTLAYELIENKIIKLYDFLDNNIEFNYDILNNKNIFNQIKKDNIVDMRYYVNKTLEKSKSSIIEEKFERYEKDMIESYDSKSKMFKGYIDINKDNVYEKLEIISKENPYLLSMRSLFKLRATSDIKDELIQLTTEKIRELVIDYLFKDNYYNVIINIGELLRYINYNDVVDLIDEEEYKLYKQIVDIKNLTTDEVVEIYNKYKDKNISRKFYESLRKVRNYNFENMISRLYRCKEEDINVELTEQYGIKIYELNGQSFEIIARGMDHYRPGIVIRRNCYSTINQNNLELKEYRFYYGYTDIPIDNIAHVFENDSFSIDDENNLTKKVNRIMTIEELNDYKGYSEVQILNTRKNEMLEQIRPSYIIAFDEITDAIVEEAQKQNLSIVKINTKCYKNKPKKESNIYNDECNYIEMGERWR